MNAIRMHQYGGPDVLRYEDVPNPEPQGNEVLVKVRAAAVNPFDWKVRNGSMKQTLPYNLPLTPGWDFSGTIERVGPAVSGFNVGDEVFGREDIPHAGAYAEYTTARPEGLTRKPKAIDHLHAAAVPTSGLAAWHAIVETMRLQKGQKVLIHGGSGGVGSFAIQLACWRGAEVIATGSPEHLSFLRELGATTAIDYTKQKFEEVCKDCDAVLDTIGGDTLARSWKCLKKGGILCSLVAQPADDEARKFGVRCAYVTITSTAPLGELAKLLEQGKIKSVVSEVLPLTAAQKAHEMSQTGHAKGKIVFKVAD